MAALTRDQIDVLKEFDDQVENCYGHGVPTQMTQSLVREDLIEIVTAGQHWYGRITPRGKKVLMNSR